VSRNFDQELFRRFVLRLDTLRALHILIRAPVTNKGGHAAGDLLMRQLLGFAAERAAMTACRDFALLVGIEGGDHTAGPYERELGAGPIAPRTAQELWGDNSAGR